MTMALKHVLSERDPLSDGILRRSDAGISRAASVSVAAVGTHSWMQPKFSCLSSLSAAALSGVIRIL